MATQPNNPFVLPGFGQPGELGQNPLLASMEMMRQAWQNLAGLGGFDTAGMMSAALTPEDLERRISDLRAVENWLRMNLSMLSSTIQGMEVQRATFSTLRSFVESAQAAGSTPEGVSPLEAVLGIRRGQAADTATQGAAPGAEKAAEPQPEPSSASAQTASAATDAAADATGQAMAGATAAAQGWWNMLQQQFDTLAAATSATLQGAEALKAGMGADLTAGHAVPAKKTAPRKTASTKTAARKATVKTSASGAAKAAVKTARTAAPKSGGRAGKTPNA